MRYRALKYFPIFILPGLAFISFNSYGWAAWSLVLFIFAFIPVLELIIPSDESNLTEAEEEIEKKAFIYDLLIYLIVPVQYVLLFYFFLTIGESGISTATFWGRIMSMGILCAGFGINVAHELGHRMNKSEQFLSKSLLLTSLYLHFFIEHNQGHHKNVATHEDPASSRYGETVFAFWIRSVVTGYISAWKIETKNLKRKNIPFLSLKNEMIQYTLVQVAFVLAVFYFFGLFVTASFVLAAVIGFLLLETVNYIEHYGLIRKKVSEKRYEKVLPIHSWNSTHSIGRIVLFELTRHSDHHYKASRKYQILKHYKEAPQMPTGYPGMLVMSLIPPIWFAVMHRHIAKLQKEQEQLSFAA
ncbi:alkane 1-monooxygenase [Chitinophagales bacterium]|nr:alkane 1-monooxygenase [Chitinophagales bacterium]